MVVHGTLDIAFRALVRTTSSTKILTVSSFTIHSEGYIRFRNVGLLLLNCNTMTFETPTRLADTVPSPRSVSAQYVACRFVCGARPNNSIFTDRLTHILIYSRLYYTWNNKVLYYCSVLVHYIYVITLCNKKNKLKIKTQYFLSLWRLKVILLHNA